MSAPRMKPAKKRKAAVKAIIDRMCAPAERLLDRAVASLIALEKGGIRV